MAVDFFERASKTLRTAFKPHLSAVLASCPRTFRTTKSPRFLNRIWKRLPNCGPRGKRQDKTARCATSASFSNSEAKEQERSRLQALTPANGSVHKYLRTDDVPRGGVAYAMAVPSGLCRISLPQRES